MNTTRAQMRRVLKKSREVLRSLPLPTQRKKGVLLTVCFVMVGVLLPTYTAYAFGFIPFLVAGGGLLAGAGAYFGLLNGTGNLLMQGLAALLVWLSGVAAWLMATAGSLLDAIIEYTIVQNPLRDIPGVAIGWSVIRDVSNMFFIFLLLFIAISTIIGIQKYGARTLLARLIVVALLINFSLFFTQLVYDGSNLLALSLYSQMAESKALPTRADTNTGGRERAPLGISVFFMQHMGIEKAFQKEQIEAALRSTENDGGAKHGQIAAIALMLIIVFLITAWVFLQLAIIFIARFVAFIFLMVLSPGAFIANIFPETQKYFSRWLDELLKQAIVAPLTLLLFFVIFAILSGGRSRTDPFLIQLLSSPQDAFNIGAFMQFVIIIALLIWGYRFIKSLSGQMGTSLATFATGTVQKAGGFAGGATLGGVGLAGRMTAGLLGSKLATSERLKNLAASERSGLRGRAERLSGKLALRTSKGLAKASYDIREVKPVAAAAQKVGVNLGKATGKGGYENAFESQVKREAQFAEKVIGTSVKTESEQRQEQQVRQRLEIATKAVPTAEERVRKLKADPNATQRDIASAENALKLVKERQSQEQKILDDTGRIVAKRGDARKLRYAENLGTERTIDTAFTKVPRKNKEAAARIRRGKTAEQRVLDELTKRLSDDPTLKSALKPEEPPTTTS